jgi:hypothetical protein
MQQEFALRKKGQFMGSFGSFLTAKNHTSCYLSCRPMSQHRDSEAGFARFEPAPVLARRSGLVAWSPLLLVSLLAGILKSPLGTFGAVLLASLLTGGLAILSVALPERGLPDRLAGTWPVPR